jgi:hypothetical protein
LPCAVFDGRASLGVVHGCGESSRYAGVCRCASLRAEAQEAHGGQLYPDHF